MYHRVLAPAAMALLFGSLPCGAASSGTSIHVNVVGLHSDRGVVRCFLYNSKTGFPKDQAAAFAKASTAISGEKASCDFSSVPNGEYAISVYHDENNNDHLDANFLGIPKEGVGASNDAKGHMGPPSFNDARFQVAGEAQILTIHTHYL